MAVPKRVLVVDDQAVIRKLLTDIINTSPLLTVVGEAADPLIARDEIKRLNPDVITLDIEMPRMDGLTFLKNLMRLRPMPVVMISTLTERGAPATLEALELGAVDYIAKPTQNLQANLSAYSDELIDKVVTAANAHVRQLKLEKTKNIQTAASTGVRYKSQHLFAIGASTGGTEAIKEVLLDMPEDCPPIVIAQHIPPVFSTSYAMRLDASCAMNVHEASHGQIIEPGNVYIAPGDDHLTVRKKGVMLVCALDQADPVNRHRPSVDVLFDSVAVVAQQNSTAAILTGMGKDGAEGLLNIRNAGGITIAQDEETSVVWGMPGAAVGIDAAGQVMPLQEIARKMLFYAKK